MLPELTEFAARVPLTIYVLWVVWFVVAAGLVFYTGRQLRPVSEIHGEDLHKQSIWSIHLELPFIKLVATSRLFTRTLSSRSGPSMWRRD